MESRTLELLASAKKHLKGAQSEVAEALASKAFKGDVYWTWATNEAHRVSLCVAAALLSEVGIQAQWEWAKEKESPANQDLARAWQERFGSSAEFAAFSNLPAEAVRYIQVHNTSEVFDQLQARARVLLSDQFLSEAERYLGMG